MNTTAECYISDKDIELAQTIALYLGVGVIALCSCLVVRCCCVKRCC